MHKNELGKIGEEIAMQFLRGKGYAIRHTNWVHHPYEIDIIAIDKNITVFVEVKTRKGDYNGNPEDAVSKTKIAHIKSAAEVYMQDNPVDLCRIDVVAITISGEQEPDVVHFEDVF